MGYQDDLLKIYNRKVTGHGSENKVSVVMSSLFSMTTHMSADWHLPESLEKNIPVFSSLHTHTGG